MNLFNRIYERIFQKGARCLPFGATRAERGRYGEDIAERYCRKELGYQVLPAAAGAR